jgi:hypothetical protein
MELRAGQLMEILWSGGSFHPQNKNELTAGIKLSVWTWVAAQFDRANPYDCALGGSSVLPS